ncbi:MAG TPA: TetR family transcriptional regulator [Solirubrobacteraceae bacterium]|nr:TetR family transcriptional regulator [Solirubrobacteraceae bacterium]
MARRRDQAQRRREIVSATSRLVAEKGLTGVRLRDVAEAAGLTSGAVLYYYDGLDELFTAAYDLGVHRYCEERERAVAKAGSAAERLRVAVELGLPSGVDDTVTRMLYELEGVALRSAECAALMSAYVERQVAMYSSILEVGASTGELTLTGPVRGIARNIIGLEDGHGIYVLAGRERLETVLAWILDYVAAATGLPRPALDTAPV